MFEKNQYVYHETGGICKIDDLRHAPLDGMPKDRLYYVLSPMQDQNSKIYVPVDSKGVFLRAVMGGEEAKDLIEQIPTIEPLEEENAKLLRLQYIETMRKHQPAEWVRVIKTVHRRAQMKTGKARLSDSERSFAEQATRNLLGELRLALGADAQTAECALWECIGTIET